MMMPRTQAAAADLVRRIDAAGGPPSHLAAEYQAARSAVAGLEMSGLGFLFVAPWIWGALVTAAAAVGVYHVAKQTGRVADAAGNALRKATTAALWIGGAWLAAVAFGDAQRRVAR